MDGLMIIFLLLLSCFLCFSLASVIKEVEKLKSRIEVLEEGGKRDLHREGMATVHGGSD
jgi:hypothetical protein